MIVVNGQLSGREIEAARKVHLFSTLSFRVAVVMLVANASCALILGIPVILAGWFSVFAAMPVGFAAIAVAAAAMIAWALAGRAGPIEVPGPESRSRLAPFEMRFDDTGLHLHNQFGSKFLAWSGAYRVAGSREMLLIYHDATHYEIVPWRLFETESARGKVKAWARLVQDHSSLLEKLMPRT